MIHGKTAQMQQRRTRRVVAVIAAVVLAVLLWFAWDMTSAQTEAQSAASVRTAVLDAAMQCAAVEGAYPARLSYLEEHYGLIVNHQDYAVTYYRPTYSGADVQWKDNQGVKGKIDYLKQYHDQPSYYPAWIGTDSYTLYGPCLKSRTYDQSGNGSYWVNGEYDWGYADNFGNDRLSEDDNAAAGAMKVYFKISNAVDKNGQPADLKYIDFIRVQTGVNAKAGWLGENSTEVFGFTDENINQGK